MQSTCRVPVLVFFGNKSHTVQRRMKSQCLMRRPLWIWTQHARKCRMQCLGCSLSLSLYIYIYIYIYIYNILIVQKNCNEHHLGSMDDSPPSPTTGQAPLGPHWGSMWPPFHNHRSMSTCMMTKAWSMSTIWADILQIRSRRPFRWRAITSATNHKRPYLGVRRLRTRILNIARSFL